MVHSFNNNGKDGYYSSAGLIFDADGNLYGTTSRGGPYTYGEDIELTPIYPCARCSHTVSSGEVDVLPAERRDLLRQGGIGRP